MNKISSYVMIKKEIEFDGKPVYRAYFRGTTNRVRRDTGLLVSGYTRKANLLFDLRNNPMERGVIIRSNYTEKYERKLKLASNRRFKKMKKLLVHIK